MSMQMIPAPGPVRSRRRKNNSASLHRGVGCGAIGRFTMPGSDHDAPTVGSDPLVTRRQVLQLAATTLLTGAHVRLQRSKKIIVAGAGIGGLSCAWELVRRGHDVTVVEAAA